MSRATRALGIDVGATKVAAAVVHLETGATGPVEMLPTAPERGGAAVLADCVALAESLARPGEIDVVGIGICELVDLDGEVRSGDAVDWRGIALQAAFDHIAPARLESDVRAAALAEARLGAGRGQRCFLFVNVGSGISSTLVIDGRPHAGANGNAILLGAGPLCVERTASGRAIAGRAGATSAAEVIAAADRGEAAARALLRQAGDEVGRAVAFAVNLLDPESVVYGGGIATNSGDFVDGLSAAIRRERWVREGRDLPLIRAALGSAAGIVGAALAAAERVG